MVKDGTRWDEREIQRAVGMFPPGVGAERRRYCTHVDSSMGGAIRMNRT